VRRCRLWACRRGWCPAPGGHPGLVAGGSFLEGTYYCRTRKEPFRSNFYPCLIHFYTNSIPFSMPFLSLSPSMWNPQGQRRCSHSVAETDGKKHLLPLCRCAFAQGGQREIGSTRLSPDLKRQATERLEQ
jgi:hypothetical protein